MMLEKIKINIKKYSFNKLLIVFIFSLILSVLPFFSGGKDVIARFILLAFMPFLVLLVWNKLRREEIKIIKLPFIFLVLFILMMTVSVTYSPEKYLGIMALLVFLACSILFFLIYLFVDSKELVNYFAYLVIGVSIVIVILGIYNFVLSENFTYLRMNFPFYYHIPLGEFLIYPMFLSLSLIFLKSLNSLSRITLILIVSLLVVSFFFTYCRGAWISFLLISLVLILIIRRIRILFRKQVIASLLLIALISSISIFGLSQLKSSQAAEVSKEATYFTDTAKENAFTARSYFWARAVDIFKDRPILGGGLESYRALHRQYIQPPFYYSVYPHNFLLRILAEMGIISFLFFSGFIISLAYYSYQLLKRIKSNLEKTNEMNKNDLLLLGMIGGIGGAAIHNLVNFGWAFPSNLIIFFIFSGMILKSYTLKSGKGKKSHNKIFIPIFFLSLLLFFAGWMFFISDSYFQKGLDSLDKGEDLEAIYFWEKALKINPINSKYSGQIAFTYFSLAKEDIKRRPGFLSQAKFFNEKAISWDAGAGNLNLRAEISLFERNYPLAEESFKSAIDKSPCNLNAYLGLTNLYLNQKRFSDIHYWLDKILPRYKKEYVLSPLYVHPDKENTLFRISSLHNINGLAYLNEDRFEETEEEFKKAISYFPQNELAYKNLIILKKNQGDIDSARNYLEEGIRNNPDSKILIEVKL